MAIRERFFPTSENKLSQEKVKPKVERVQYIPDIDERQLCIMQSSIARQEYASALALLQQLSTLKMFPVGSIFTEFKYVYFFLTHFHLRSEGEIPLEKICTLALELHFDTDQHGKVKVELPPHFTVLLQELLPKLEALAKLEWNSRLGKEKNFSIHELRRNSDLQSLAAYVLQMLYYSEFVPRDDSQEYPLEYPGFHKLWERMMVPDREITFFTVFNVILKKFGPVKK